MVSRNHNFWTNPLRTYMLALRTTSGRLSLHGAFRRVRACGCPKPRQKLRLSARVMRPSLQPEASGQVTGLSCVNDSCTKLFIKDLYEHAWSPRSCDEHQTFLHDVGVVGSVSCGSDPALRQGRTPSKRNELGEMTRQGAFGGSGA